jgi:hypothetical protein
MNSVAVAHLEERLLAGVLVEPIATLGETRRVLDPALLHSHQARAIYEALIAVVDRGDVPGIAGVWAELTSSGAESLFPGGIGALEVLADILQAPSPVETIQIAGKIADMARQRRAQTAATAYAKEPTAERRAALETALREQAQAETAGAKARPPVRQLDLEAAPGASSIEFFPMLGREGYIGRAVTTLLSSLPKRGKTTLLFWLARGFCEMGLRVLYLSEESEPVIRERAEMIGVPLDIFYVRTGRPWAEVVAWLAEQEADVVIVDTTRAWLGLPESGENDASTVQQALDPLQIALRTRNAGLILSHHLRKSGGEDGTGHAGSGAFVGLCDVAVELHGDPHDPRRRALRSVSRLSQTPPRLIIELQEGAYVVVGTEGAVALADLESEIEALLEANAPEAMTEPEITVALEADPPPSRTHIRNALSKSDRIDRIGEGKKGAPYAYRIRF